MASLKGQCALICTGNQRACWHQDCKILRRFTSGKFLIENKNGKVQAAVPYDLIFSNAEKNIYKQYNLEADAWVLEADAKNSILGQTMASKLQSKINFTQYSNKK